MHKNDKLPAICRYNDGSTENDCEAKCNAFKWCLGYSYKATDHTCSLVTSTGSCTIGKAANQPDNIATTHAQLKEKTAGAGWNCMLKPEAGIKLSLNLDSLLGGFI